MARGIKPSCGDQTRRKTLAAISDAIFTGCHPLDCPEAPGDKSAGLNCQRKTEAGRHRPFDLQHPTTPRSHNLLLACSMPHASDWLLAPPIPGLGLSLQSDVFRTALKFRLGIPLFDAPFPCPALDNNGKACKSQMDVFGDHAPCCHNSPSLVFRHNNVRDILGRSARGAGLAAVVIENRWVERETRRYHCPAVSPRLCDLSIRRHCHSSVAAKIS